MGKLLLIAVLVLGVSFCSYIMSMNKQAVKLPGVLVNEISSKETQNLSNYALRYALQFAVSQHFPARSGFTKKQAFTNFFYKYGYIDSLRYSYVPSMGNFLVTAYTRTIVSGKNVTHVSKAALRGITNIGGKGDIFHLSFENNFLDSSPNHNDGTGYGSIRFKGNGLYNNCIWPDGNDDYITVQDNDMMDLPSEFSVVVWPNWNSNPNGWIPILWKGLPTTNPNYNVHPAYGIWLYQDYLYAGVTTASGQYIQAVSTFDIKPQGNWHFIAVTYGQNYIKLYYDGVICGQTSATTSQPINSDQNLRILSMTSTASGTIYFKGRFDEIGVYDYVLTAEQVLAIYNSPYGILPNMVGNPIVDYVRE
jgi:hypothetical protein